MLDINSLNKNKHNSIKELKRSIHLYSKVSIMFRHKIIEGSVINISEKGVQIKEDKNKYTYKWSYIMGVNNK